MRHVVVGSTHFSMFILKAIREADPQGIIYTVERSPEVAEIMSRQVSGKPVHGLLTEQSTLENAGIRIADTFFALTDSDALNANLVELSKKVYSVPLTISIANNPKNVDLLYKSGSDYVLSPVDYVTGEVKALLSIDKPSRFSLPQNIGMDFIVMRPVNSIEAIDSIFSFISKESDVKDVMVTSATNGSIKKIEELAKGDFLVIAVRKTSSKELLESLEEILKKSSGGSKK
ncbi:MAG: NAD(P)-binding protein [Fervidicoccaceae archaeon]